MTTIEGISEPADRPSARFAERVWGQEAGRAIRNSIFSGMTRAGAMAGALVLNEIVTHNTVVNLLVGALGFTAITNDVSRRHPLVQLARTLWGAEGEVQARQKLSDFRSGVTLAAFSGSVAALGVANFVLSSTGGTADIALTSTSALLGGYEAREAFIGRRRLKALPSQMSDTLE